MASTEIRGAFMRAIFAIVALCCPVIAIAQIAPSFNSGCTIGPQGSMSCGGLGPRPGAAESPNEEGKKGPSLSTLYIRLEPEGTFESRSFPGDCVLIGINGGDLLNEKAPFRHLYLDKDTVTLMPKEQPFRLRNHSSKTVEFQVIEIQR
jgi:hypothetical protein